MLEKIESDLIIFDWSGTLSDDRLPVFYSINEMLTSLKLRKLAYEEFLESYRASLGVFIRENGLDMNDFEALNLYKKHFQKTIEKGIVPKVYPQALKTIPKIKEKGKRLSILSSHPTENLVREAREYGLSKYFDIIKGSSLVKSEGIEEVINMVGVQKQRTVYIGDVTFDIAAAKKAGVRPIGISTGYHTHQKLTSEFPDEMIIRNLEELEELID